MDKPLRIASFLGLVVTMIGIDVTAAQSIGDAAAGRNLASTWCAACHRITGEDRDRARTPPDFGAIADTSQQTELSLRVFLQTPHGQMPRYQFSRSEIDDIISYLLSLRSR
ncbi:cytochrome c [Bosea sp. 2YAB26]|uniref:c-type cytochrome n=1 Tax=Bosea sp. 2YAB26 TaxID=3237478 RepID=UPI003F922788